MAKMGFQFRPQIRGPYQPDLILVYEEDVLSGFSFLSQPHRWGWDGIEKVLEVGMCIDDAIVKVSDFHRGVQSEMIRTSSLHIGD